MLKENRIKLLLSRKILSQFQLAVGFFALHQKYTLAFALKILAIKSNRAPVIVTVTCYFVKLLKKL